MKYFTFKDTWSQWLNLSLNCKRFPVSLNNEFNITTPKRRLRWNMIDFKVQKGNINSHQIRCELSLGSLTRVFKFKRPTYQSFFKRLTCWKTNKRLKHSVILNKKQTFEKVSHVLMVKNTLKDAVTIFGFRKVQNREIAVTH